jgi:hypothetical protein
VGGIKFYCWLFLWLVGFGFRGRCFWGAFIGKIFIVELFVTSGAGGSYMWVCLALGKRLAGLVTVGCAVCG